MARFLLFIMCFTLLACGNSTVGQEDLPYLNGYWEINEVVFPDGSQKNYGINPVIDFIQLEGEQGFRKKMQPKFDGSYHTSNQTESFKLQQSHETYILSYQNNLNQWEETLIQLDSLSFTIRNEEGVQYSYKRFQPITIPK
ncbi:hypothetical protein [Flagellimonas myxillae]|uniref:hypothetical protein n=1 Tax=Flagellimonas myxillae TaxID=2942214 RepID=UPI00201F29A4|nr:hypothetical protein [Muricauda myxillae]MCL6265375.1 hypothetical protein [Muricauda myxillae]